MHSMKLFWCGAVVELLVHAFLRGEPPPPAHAPNGYPELYRYQEPFQPNFPRMYPHAAPP